MKDKKGEGSYRDSNHESKRKREAPKNEQYSKPAYKDNDRREKTFANKNGDTKAKKTVQYLDADVLDFSAKLGAPTFKTSKNDKRSGSADFDNTPIRLNKFIANAGVCSRREADDLIKMGLITVNGEEIIDFGFKVKPSDRVKYNGSNLNAEEKVYLILNKPKGYITTTSDPEDRDTVVDLVKGATQFRVYPVGRLDRNTTGVLLLTNDGDFMEKITHPKFSISKIYKVAVDRKVTLAEMEQLLEGVMLEDGIAKADAIAFLDETKTNIGIEIHSGKNRVIRRMFEHLELEVKKLDRTAFGPFTKTKLRIGESRFLNDKEMLLVNRLKNQKIKGVGELKDQGAKSRSYAKEGYTKSNNYSTKPAYGNRDRNTGDSGFDDNKKKYPNDDKKDWNTKPAYGNRDRNTGDSRFDENKKKYPNDDRKDWNTKPAYGNKDRNTGDSRFDDNKKKYPNNDRKDWNTKPAYGNKDRNTGDSRFDENKKKYPNDDRKDWNTKPAYGNKDRNTGDSRFDENKKKYPNDDRKDWNTKPAYGNKDRNTGDSRFDDNKKRYPNDDRKDWNTKPAYGNKDRNTGDSRFDDNKKKYPNDDRKDWNTKPAYGNKDRNTGDSRFDDNKKKYSNNDRKDWNTKPAYGNKDRNTGDSRFDDNKKKYSNNDRKDWNTKPAYGNNDSNTKPTDRKYDRGAFTKLNEESNEKGDFTKKRKTVSRITAVKKSEFNKSSDSAKKEDRTIKERKKPSTKPTRK